jgi:hypothetical protein
MNETTFTLTLIKDGESSKILVSHGETPAKDDDEADAVISKEQLTSTYSAIESAIPNFRDAEDGCEDWVTHTTEEFLDIYDLDLIKVFEDADDDASDDELSDKDSTGENTTEDEIKDEPKEDEETDEKVDEPEFDSDLFKSSSEMTNPEEIFLVTFKPENLQSAMNKLEF